MKALYEYSSPHSDDLSFPNDQVINVTEEEDTDWYYGYYEDTLGVKHEGLFPKNFVKMHEPETPPRPSRLSRSKKELEPSVLPNQSPEVNQSEPPPALPANVITVALSKNGVGRSDELAPAATFDITEDVRSSGIPIVAPPTNLATKPAPPVAKLGPPPVAEKPATGSFRDRINAFNKPAAPVAPSKPSVLGTPGGSSFVKKPFVAPPPSKNAYVPPPREPPPQKFYRREEDPEVVAQSSNNVEGNERGALQRNQGLAEEEDDIPKPTSLKDRIALLQKQQMEQAARHAESGQKKEKPKRPPKKQMESQERGIGQDEHPEVAQLERSDTGETMGKRSVDIFRDDQWPNSHVGARSHKSREATPLASPITSHQREILSDANDADQSGAGDTEDGEEVSTGRDDSDEKPRSKISVIPQRSSKAPTHEADVGDEEENADEEEEEVEVDPEVKRRMEIRERMAKMSGGMGMAGMFGPPGGISPMAPKKQSSVLVEGKALVNPAFGTPDAPSPRAPPISMVPMLGLQKVGSAEQEYPPVEVRKEETDSPRSIVRGRDSGELPDIEDLKEGSLPPSRRSTERAMPPPVPQGAYSHDDIL